MEIQIDRRAVCIFILCEVYCMLKLVGPLKAAIACIYSFLFCASGAWASRIVIGVKKPGDRTIEINSDLSLKNIQ